VISTFTSSLLSSGSSAQTTRLPLLSLTSSAGSHVPECPRESPWPVKLEKTLSISSVNRLMSVNGLMEKKSPGERMKSEGREAPDQPSDDPHLAASTHLVAVPYGSATLIQPAL